MIFIMGLIVTMIQNRAKNKIKQKSKEGEDFITDTDKDEKYLQSLIMKGKDIYRELIKTNDFETALFESLNYVKERIATNYNVREFRSDKSPVFEIPSYDLFFKEINKSYKKERDLKIDHVSYVVSQIENFFDHRMKQSDDIKSSVTQKTNGGLYDFKNIIGQEKISVTMKALANSLLLYMPQEEKNPASPFPEKMLFYGSSGIGKSFTVKVCKEYIRNKAVSIGLNFKTASISPDVFSKYIWESEKSLKGVFDELEKNTGINLIVIDEADTIFPRRKSKENSRGYDSITGEILRILDDSSMRNNGKSLMFFISNRPKDGLDPALVSRMELKLKFNEQFSLEEYAKISQLYLKTYQINENKLDFNAEYLAKASSEFALSPRDLKNVIINIGQKMRFEPISSLLDSDDFMKKLISMDYEKRSSEINQRLNMVTKGNLEEIISNQVLSKNYENNFL